MLQDFVGFAAKYVGNCVLEVGAGTGEVLKRLGRTGTFAVGADISFAMAKAAKAKGVQMLVADSEHLPFRQNSFDLVIFHSTLHHFPKLKLALEDANRVLKTNGHALIWEPNSSFLAHLNGFSFWKNLDGSSFRRFLLFLIIRMGVAVLRALRVPTFRTMKEPTPPDSHRTIPISELKEAIRSAGLEAISSEELYFLLPYFQHFRNDAAFLMAQLFDTFVKRVFARGGYIIQIVARK